LNFSIEEMLYLPSGNGLTTGLSTRMESSTPAPYRTTVIDISINYLVCCDHIYLLFKTMQLPTLDLQRDTKMVSQKRDMILIGYIYSVSNKSSIGKIPPCHDRALSQPMQLSFCDTVYKAVFMWKKSGESQSTPASRP
jgi:hypothetical protein